MAPLSYRSRENWTIGPTDKTITTVPYPYEPPSKTPIRKAVKSIPILDALILGPILEIPVIIPSLGPGPRPEPTYIPTPEAKSTVPK